MLRALDYFRAANCFDDTEPDPRLQDGIELVRAKQDDTGRWQQDWTPRGATLFDLDDGSGRPSRWLTLRALRVLRWWDDRT